MRQVRLARCLFVLFLMFVPLFAPSCSTGRLEGDLAPVSDKPQPEIGTTKQPLKARQTITNNTTQYMVGQPCDLSLNLETASVVMPPGTLGCQSNGRALVSFGGWLQQVDLNFLGNPGAGLAGGQAKQRPFSDVSILNVPANFPQIPTQPCGSSCCGGTTAPKYWYGGGDTSLIRSGPNSLFMLIAGDSRRTRNASTKVCDGAPNVPCQPEKANAINFALRSTSCGNSWTPVAIDRGNGQGGPANASEPCNNLDYAWAYADPYKSLSGNHFIYLTGETGWDCCGGPSETRLYRSTDGGASFQYKATLSDRAAITGITSFDDGTTVAFGCTENNPPSRARIYWSRGNNDTVFEQFDWPNLACSSKSIQNGNITRGAPIVTGLSRVSDPSLSPSYNYVRLLVQTGTTATGNTVQLGYAAIPRNGSGVPAKIVGTSTIPRLTGTSDIFRASFIEPDRFTAGKTSDTPLLYWQEIDSSGNHTMRYSVGTGLSTYTPPRHLSVNGTTPVSWQANLSGSPKHGLEYDRGSSWFDSTSNSATSVVNYFAQWSQSRATCNPTPNAYIHYNTVQVTEPSFTAPQSVQTSILLGVDPSATRVITSSGVRTVHVIAGDGGTVGGGESGGGTVQRQIFNASTNSWSEWAKVGSGAGVGTKRAPAAVSWGPGRLDVFAIGHGGAVDKHMLHYPEQNGAQLLGGTGWEDLGAPPNGFGHAPSVASNGPNHLFIVGADTFGQVFYKTWKNAWSNWLAIPNSVLVGAPSAFSAASNRVDIVGRATNNRPVHYTAFNSGTATWEGAGTWVHLSSVGLDRVIHGTPSAAVRGTNRFDIFAGDGQYPYITGPTEVVGYAQVMHAFYDAEWSSWHTIGGILPKDSSATNYTSTGAVALSPSTVWVFNRGAKDNFLYVQKHEACGHDVCQTGAALVDTCDSCVSTICDNDTFCCSSSWDSDCVGHVQGHCGMRCN
jgi:hypothetical protein